MEKTTTIRRLIFQDDYGSVFKWPEYLVFATVLVASLGIGVFYGFFSKKNSTNEEFLMAGRSMSVFPVTLSIICSFVSAISLMGNPVEVYFYGLIYAYSALTFIPMTLALAYLYLPVWSRLKLTSAYEYFEMRFNRSTRIIMSVSAIIHLMIYMPLTVAGINKYWSSAVIFIVCIAYSSIGGLKAVLWSDALQAVVMFGSIITVIVAGVNEVGGLSVVWERAEATGRTELLNFDSDPRTRHTFWTGVIAVYFTWIPLFAGTQAQVQRYLSVPTIRDARFCLLFNMIGLMIVIGLSSIMGLLIFAKYFNCDPVSVDAGIVSSSDQLLPLFVMDVLGDYPGLPGLLLAGLTCGSLSSVSSALNALPAVIVEDFVKHYRPGLSDVQLGRWSKIISLVGGMISFALIFVIASVGNILPFGALLHGTFLGPIIGAFSLGMFFPWSNSLGVILATIPTLGITLFLGLGSILARNAGDLPNQKLHLRTDGCYMNSTESLTNYTLDSMMVSTLSTAWKDEEYSGLIKVLSISYNWQPMITILSQVIFGLLFSVIINMYKRSPPVKARYMTPIVVSMWKAILGKKRLKTWIEFEDDDTTEKKLKKYSESLGMAGMSTIPTLTSEAEQLD